MHTGFGLSAAVDAKLVLHQMANSKLMAALALTLGLSRPSSASLNGVWRSEGWASLYQVRGKLLRSFEVTRKTCVEGFSAERMDSQTVENGATFGVHRGDLLYLIPGGVRTMRASGTPQVWLASQRSCAAACQIDH